MFRGIVIIILVCFFLLSAVLAQGEVVYQTDGMDAVTVRNVEYRAPLTMDVYYPPDIEDNMLLPVVIFVNGFRDSRISQFIGSDLKDAPFITSWGRLVAANGLIAVAFESEQSDDLETLVAFIRENAESLQIDGDRIGLFASSSNPPAAISYANQDGREYIKVAVFYYGSMITPDGSLDLQVSRECSEVGCYGPRALAPIERLRDDLPTLVVRVGRDNGENPTIDHYVAVAIESNVPLTFINHSNGSHGFDTLRSGREILAQSQEIVAFTLDYLIFHLMAE